MSFDALAWAGKCNPGSASRKLVLFALADRHSTEENGAYPSIAWIASFTSLNRKTIINALGELETGGFISDTGNRRGETAQIKVYRLHIETVPKVEQSQKRNSTEKCAKESQKRDTDTVTEPITPVSSNEETAPRLKNGEAVGYLQDAWNAKPAQQGAIECRRMGPARKRRAQGFVGRYSVEDITEAIDAVARSDFLCGKGKTKFRADIEFLFSDNHMNRLLEGFYDA